ncbi:MAG: hypothetical protein GXP63_04685 [DPANN group archaeon]|nr:hypothetical protein [DPANN group archaeon]
MVQKLDLQNSREIKKIKRMLEDQFGFSGPLDYAFLKNHQQKLFIINPEVFRLNLDDLRVDKIGLYFGEVKDDTLRLSIEGSQLVGPHASKNIVVLDDPAVRQWMAGETVERAIPGNPYVLIRNSRGDFLGCGKASKRGILNFFPKTRRISFSSSS